MVHRKGADVLGAGALRPQKSQSIRGNGGGVTFILFIAEPKGCQCALSEGGPLNNGRAMDAGFGRGKRSKGQQRWLACKSPACQVTSGVNPSGVPSGPWRRTPGHGQPVTFA